MLSYKKGFDESFITFLPEDDHKVFNREHPIPANALKGNEAVMKYLDLK